MPITTAFDPKKYESSVEAILKEFLSDYFSAATHIITFQPPSSPTKPTLWLQIAPSRNREKRTSDGKGKWVQGKNVLVLMSALSSDRSTTITMADEITGAILASSSALGTAGLRYAEVTPFQDVPVESQPSQFRRMASLSFVVEIRA